MSGSSSATAVLALAALLLGASADASAAGRDLDAWCAEVLGKDREALSASDRKGCKERYAKESAELQDLDEPLDLDAAPAARETRKAQRDEPRAEPKAAVAQPAEATANAVLDLDTPEDGKSAKAPRKGKSSQASAGAAGDDIGLVGEEADEEAAAAAAEDPDSGPLEDDTAEDLGPAGAGGEDVVDADADIAPAITVLDDEPSARDKRRAARASGKKGDGKKGTALGEGMDDAGEDLE